MTSKERAEYRSKANTLTPSCQIGKNGLSEGLYKQVDQELTARELIKLKVLLESCPVTPKEAARDIAEHTGADVISVVGGVIVLYRYSEELHKKQAQKKANIRRAEKIRRSNERQRRGAKFGKDRNFRRDV
ncbi:MAG: YhbY family RNA-binding protein [Acutalibacteraceae bacterium]|jgi:RNA-binding protein|nr:YhbY family RNA-binding protein [Acutalibacteraceae bacterium]